MLCEQNQGSGRFCSQCVRDFGLPGWLPGARERIFRDRGRGCASGIRSMESGASPGGRWNSLSGRHLHRVWRTRAEHGGSDSLCRGACPGKILALVRFPHIRCCNGACSRGEPGRGGVAGEYWESFDLSGELRSHWRQFFWLRRSREWQIRKRTTSCWRE